MTEFLRDLVGLAGTKLASAAAIVPVVLYLARRRDERRDRERERLLAIADDLGVLKNMAYGYLGATQQPLAKARLKTRLGRGTDLPKTRALLDVHVGVGDSAGVVLVGDAEAEVEAALAH